VTELKQPRRSACLSGVDDTSLSSLMHSRYSGKDEVMPEIKERPILFSAPENGSL